MLPNHTVLEFSRLQLPLSFTHSLGRRTADGAEREIAAAQAAGAGGLPPSWVLSLSLQIRRTR